jgi:hypothetical protein
MPTVPARRRQWTLGGLMIAIGLIGLLLIFPAIFYRRQQMMMVAAQRAMAAERDARARAEQARLTATYAEQMARASAAFTPDRDELERLRRENDELKRRIQELEGRPRAAEAPEAARP